ncbi:MAG: Ig-like domain-containing protein [Alphaproteobacteria bacterium]
MKNKYFRIGLPVGLGVVIAGVLAGVFLSGGGDKASAPTGAEVASTEEQAAPAEAAVESATENAAGDAAVSADGTAAEASGTAPTPADEQAASTADAPGADQAASGDAPPRAKPSFDVVRIDPKGGTVMAGRAAPGAEIIIRDGETELGRATANQRGEWVFTDERPMPAGDRQLSLEDPAPGGSESENVVVVSVPASEPTLDQEGQAPQERQTALAVLQPRDGGPSVVLQLPEETVASADGAPRAAVDSIDYTPEGEITVSGQAEPGARLNVYVDNQPVATAQADDQGRWRTTLGEGVSEGQHQLRIDSVDQAGKVITRAETAIAKAPKTMLELGGETLVIVQPGNSLWRIARRTYGGGVHYTEIYQANADQIRDPSLIYPGQILTVPPLG